MSLFGAFLLEYTTPTSRIKKARAIDTHSICYDPEISAIAGSGATIKPEHSKATRDDNSKDSKDTVVVRGLSIGLLVSAGFWVALAGLLFLI